MFFKTCTLTGFARRCGPRMRLLPGKGPTSTITERRGGPRGTGIIIVFKTGEKAVLNNFYIKNHFPKSRLLRFLQQSGSQMAPFFKAQGKNPHDKGYKE